MMYADGRTGTENVVAMHMNVNNNAGAQILPNFVPIQCAIVRARRDGEPPVIRLGGPFLRSQLFTGTIPDGNKDLWAFDVRAHWGQVRSVPPNVVNPLGNRPLPASVNLDRTNKGARNY